MTTHTLTCASLIDSNPEVWKNATVHPFLQQCQQGTIKAAQFNTWLVQDYLFVGEFTRFAARVLANAPIEHMDTLLGGMGALKDELLWFQEKAAERSLDLNTAAQATCEEYCEFMRSLTNQPYAIQATAFWAIELSYNQGWQKHSPMPEPYTEFADRWGNQGFTDYVQVLAQQADSALVTANDSEKQEAEQAFITVAKLEQAFWQMAFEQE